MPWTSEHAKWLVDTGERLKTADGKDVEVWEFQHQDDDLADRLIMQGYDVIELQPVHSKPKNEVFPKPLPGQRYRSECLKLSDGTLSGQRQLHYPTR